MKKCIEFEERNARTRDIGKIQKLRYYPNTLGPQEYECESNM